MILVAVIALGGAAASARSETGAPNALPPCNAADFSDEQIQAAAQRAIQKGSEAGLHVESINSPDFATVVRQLATELGCRLPDGNVPTSQPHAPGHD